jgi:hypothetical protein
MPALNARHYEALAAGIKAANAEAVAAHARTEDLARAINVPPRKAGPLPFQRSHAATVAALLASNNPRFQADHFLAACGFGEWKATRRKRDRTGRLIGPPPSGSWQSGG